MNQEYIESQVISLTRKIHPQDLGEKTSKLENTLRQALEEVVAEDRARVMEELDQQVMWYNLNNQIPESELSKGQEHWDMIRKAIKDSLQEVQSRIQNSLDKPETL